LRKVITIIFLGILTASCSVLKKGSNRGLNTNAGLNNINILERVEKQNITKESFFIQKAEIEIFSKEGKEKFIANIKFEFPDKFLISIKSRTGIEGARIYISKDSIFVNDRINKKLYLGNSYFLQKKYGIDQKMLPVLFGDIILNEKDRALKAKCTGNKFITNCDVKGIALNYEIDCNRGKVVSVARISSLNQTDFIVRYDKFFYEKDVLIPEIIEFEDSAYSMKIHIKIKKIEFPWVGKVKFVPGKGYEIIELV
jgi:hypothetical protein